ncbi:Med5-domain-containing protein [Delitschia confertaspora ATCC 74209]|uniref:Mediator of RNA polymerase II transcription subunit 5 n=1 Tax=Delitschia confertaspora ATCC 74209 TaxID=1513339 RepID=A0A9P4MVJ8_9PLEO|nr:Med5-domain-containing protein [Delitschia confertaspora ATCC 74209]
MDSLINEWSVFLDRSLEQRVRPDLFEAASRKLYGRSPIPGRKLAELLLRPRIASSITVDPRIIIYLESLLALNKVDAADVLVSAFKYSRDRPPKLGEEAIPSKDDQSRWQNPLELEEVIFHRLHKALSTGERPVSNNEAFGTVSIVSEWMSAMVASHTSDSMIQAMAGIQQHPQQQSINVRDALGMLVAGLIENVKIIELLNRPQLKELRKRFAQSLSSFIPFLSQTSLQMANRLEMSQKEHDFHDKSLTNLNGENGETNLGVAALQLEAVMDLPAINTRAGLYVFLNSILVGRPLTDDITIINYLNSRYNKIHTQNMSGQNVATDLITAAFDILSNAMYRSESSQTIFSLKSFLVNKIPILLTQLTHSIYPLTPEYSITQALSHVDRNAFPAFSQGFDDIMGNNNVLSDVRQDFLNACALHHLIPVNIIESLLGETPIQGPPATKYTKNELLRLCQENFEKVNMYVDELENLDGNGGAIVGVVTEFISHLCDTQMTMYLQSICNHLSKKPLALDVMLQFTSPASILKPLCQFLEEWRYEGDQGEYQPVYDEFGAILILILAFVHRYSLSFHDLGIGQDTFVAQLLERGHMSVSPDELTEEQGGHLGNWLRGLYDSDKEGLSNEVFSSCRPQQFYLIVPTIFSQTVYACSGDVLSLDSVKGGLEYLHETNLLPSLVGGLSWMAAHALEQTHQDIDIVMQMFHKLIRSAPTSADAQGMHSTILSIVSSRLEKCFRTLQRRHPTRTDIEPLLAAIKPNLNYERSLYSSMSELEQWTSTPGNTLRGCIRTTIRDLSIWCTGTSLQLSPPGYTHRQLHTSLRILGASKTLRAILDEVKAQTDAGSGAVALDIAASLICAPSTENSAIHIEWLTSPIPASLPPRTGINLREMLKAEFDNAAGMLTLDPLAAETIVRLHRRVEAQLALMASAGMPAQQIELPDVSMVGVESQHISQMGMDAVSEAAAASMAATGAQDVLQQELNRQLDLSATGGGLDLSSMGNGMGTGAMGTGTAGAGGMDLGMGNMQSMGGMGDLDLSSMGMGDGEDDWGLDFDGM